MPAPVAAAQVNVNAPSEIKPPAPKPRPDAPDFHDALKQARGKPLDPAEEAQPQKTSNADQPLSLPSDEEQLPVDTDEVAGATPPVEPSPDQNDAGEVLVALAVQSIAPVVAVARADQVEGDDVDAEAPVIPVARVVPQPVEPVETEEAALSSLTPAPIVAAVEVPDDEATEPGVAAKVAAAVGEVVVDAPERPVPRVVEPAPAKHQPRDQQPQNDQPAAPAAPPAELPDKPVLPAEEGEVEQPPAPVQVHNVGEPRETTPSATPAPTTFRADVVAAGTVETKPLSQSASEPASAPAAPPPPPTARELEFARANHDRIVTDIRAQLLPRGGSMQIRLDPPQLGALQVAVQMLDGVMSVSFQTSNEEATQLLSHSLTQLKHVLESQGVNVDKLHVQQAPRSEQSSNNSNDSDPQRDQRHGAHEENLARQEQQRKEMLRRLWRRLALGNDPLDLVA